MWYCISSHLLLLDPPPPLTQVAEIHVTKFHRRNSSTLVRASFRHYTYVNLHTAHETRSSLHEIVLSVLCHYSTLLPFRRVNSGMELLYGPLRNVPPLQPCRSLITCRIRGLIRPCTRRLESKYSAQLPTHGPEWHKGRPGES